MISASYRRENYKKAAKLKNLFRFLLQKIPKFCCLVNLVKNKRDIYRYCIQKVHRRDISVLHLKILIILKDRSVILTVYNISTKIG